MFLLLDRTILDLLSFYLDELYVLAIATVVCEDR